MNFPNSSLVLESKSERYVVKPAETRRVVFRAAIGCVFINGAKNLIPIPLPVPIPIPAKKES